jgi:hypothetical protein
MKTLMIREETWWCYIILAILVGANVFFSLRAYYSLGFFKARKEVAALASSNQEKRAIKIYLSANFFIWLIMAASSFYLLGLAYRDSLGGFTQVQIQGGSVKLLYMWPVPSRNLASSDIGQIYAVKYGKDSKVINIASKAGTFKSVTDYPEQIDADCRELREDLAINGK